jgi:RNA polymerase sigma factor (sigma-70 family)
MYSIAATMACSNPSDESEPFTRPHASCTVMEPAPDEYNLALRARAGDTEALAELVERARLRLFALAYAELRHYEDAQDAVASAFFQICLHVQELRDPERVQSWMNSIVRNQAHMLRRGARKGNVPLEETLVVGDETLPSLLRLDIERALEQLPRDQATALRLFYLAEWPVREIARKVGRPEGTIKRWLHLGRRQLATHMEEYAPMATPTTSAIPTPTAALIHTDLEPDLIEQITSALQGGGYDTRVFVPSNPFSLVDVLQESRVIILDEWIGGRSALEMVLHLKAHRETQRIPIHLLCSAPSDFTVSAYFTAGVRRLLDKKRPDSIAELEKTVDQPASCNRWFQFTESAKRVLWHAQEEARRLGERELVGPEHVLLGLVHDAESAAAHVLERLGISRESVRLAIEQEITPGESITEPGEMMLTPEGKRPIDLAEEEALSLGDNFIGTQHLLLGLIRGGAGELPEPDPALVAAGVTYGRARLATRVLTALGVDLGNVRREVALVQVEGTASGGMAEGTSPPSEPLTAGPSP